VQTGFGGGQGLLHLGLGGQTGLGFGHSTLGGGGHVGFGGGGVTSQPLFTTVVSCVETASSAAKFNENAIKLNKTILLIVYSPIYKLQLT
jgi:hypothetical protein